MKNKPTLKRGDKVFISIGTTNPTTIEYTIAKPGDKVDNPLYIGTPRFKLISNLEEGESVKEFSRRYRKNGKLLTVLEIERKKWKFATLLRNLLFWQVKK